MQNWFHRTSDEFNKALKLNAILYTFWHSEHPSRKCVGGLWFFHCLVSFVYPFSFKKSFSSPNRSRQIVGRASFLFTHLVSDFGDLLSAIWLSRSVWPWVYCCLAKTSYRQPFIEERRRLRRWSHLWAAITWVEKKSIRRHLSFEFIPVNSFQPKKTFNYSVNLHRATMTHRRKTTQTRTCVACSSIIKRPACLPTFNPYLMITFWN